MVEELRSKLENNYIHRFNSVLSYDILDSDWFAVTSQRKDIAEDEQEATGEYRVLYIFMPRGSKPSFIRIGCVGRIKSVQIHHLVPGCHKILHKLHLSICAAIHFGDGAQFSMRTKY